MQVKQNNIIFLIRLISLFPLVTASFFVNANEHTDWRGQYAGATIGFMHGKVNSSSTVSDGSYFQTGNINGLNNTFQKDFSDNDLSTTFIYGYQWQYEHWIYGLEANLFINNFSADRTDINRTYESTTSLSYDTSATIKNKFGLSIRPKIGYTFDNFLIDISAGPTLSKFKYQFNFTDSTNAIVDASDSDSRWAVGASLGLNFNYKMDNNLVIRAGYLFTYYPNAVDNSSYMESNAGIQTDEFKHDASFTAHKFSIGLVKYF